MQLIERYAKFHISKYNPPSNEFNPLEDEGYGLNNISNYVYHDVITSTSPKIYGNEMTDMVRNCLIYDSLLTNRLLQHNIKILVSKKEVIFEKTV